MNAAETIAAAIEKLETLKAESTPSPWHHWTDDLTGDVDLWHDQEARSYIATLGHSDAPRVNRDADLIVTLHRTIDAQLKILRRDIDIRVAYIARGVLAQWVEAVERAGDLDLARAILGETP
jgi:hypothetical protein